MAGQRKRTQTMRPMVPHWKNKKEHKKKRKEKNTKRCQWMNTIKSSEHLKKKKRVEAGTALKTCLFFNFFSFVLLLSVRSFRARNGFDWSNPFCWGGGGKTRFVRVFRWRILHARDSRRRDFHGISRLVPGLPKFYWVLLDFTGFYRVLPGFTGFP